MNLKKIISGLFLCILGAVLAGSISVYAKSKVTISFTPATKKETHKSLYVDFTVTGMKEIVKVDVKKGKIKSTSNKKWKKASASSYFYYDESNGTTSGSFFVYENGNYTIRVTDVAGKKAVKTIKIKNMAPCSEISACSAYIRDISKPDSNGDYTVTVDYYRQLTFDPSEFEGKKVGDTLLVEGKKVKITELMTMDEEYNISSKTKFDDSIELVVVMPDNLSDFYDLEEDSYLLDYPEQGRFGYIKSLSGDFKAYVDYDYWDGGDYYVNFEVPEKLGVKLKANKKTNVRPMLNYTDNYSITFPTFYKNLGKPSTNIEYMIDLGCANYIYEVYDKNTGEFTNYISEILQIYTP